MRTVVGVLRGGPTQYQASLKSGATVLAHLDKDKFDARDIFVDRDGVWNVRGVPAEPQKALAGVDVAFNALHGQYAAQGRLQRLFDVLGVPFTGPSAYASTLAFNRRTARDEVGQAGVRVPYGIVVERTDDIERLSRTILRTFPLPGLIKLMYGSSPADVYKAENFYDLQNALMRGFEQSTQLLLEEYIPGRRATVGVIDRFRGEDVYALIPTPQTFTQREKDELVSVAKRAHAALGSQYSTVEFAVGKRGIYFTEIEALPELHEDAVLTQSLGGVGVSQSHFLEHVLSLARNERAR